MQYALSTESIQSNRRCFYRCIVCHVFWALWDAD